MRITIVALGSRGEVQPLVALALGLHRAGHATTIATHPCYLDIGRDFGLDVVPVGPDIERVLAAHESDYLRKGRAGAARYYRLVRQALPYYDAVAHECWEVCQSADMVLHSMPSTFIAQTISEKRDIECVMAFVTPYHATREFPVPGLAPAPTWTGRLAPLYNRLTHQATVRLPWSVLGRRTNRWRRELGLSPIGTRRLYHALQQTVTLFGYSPSILPRPRDWPSKVHVTGYWFLPEPPGWEPPSALDAFLASGDTPVAVTLGSIGAKGANHIATTVVAAVRKLGLRAVLCGLGASSTAEELGNDVFGVSYVPHDWLFERVRAVVHHGGAGTTARSLWAGVPSVVIPLTVDQPFWAERLRAAGVAPSPLRVGSLTVAEATQALQTAVSNADTQRRARAFGCRIRSEDGVARAARILSAQGSPA